MGSLVAIDRIGQMHPYQHSSSNTLSSAHPQPTLGSLFPLKLLQASPSMWHACTCNPFLFLSCSINLSVQPDVGRESCIPNTKNNHFSVTGAVVVGVPERGVWVCEWAGVAVLGSTHSLQASDLTAFTVEGEEWWRWKVQYIFCKPSPESVKCLLH